MTEIKETNEMSDKVARAMEQQAILKAEGLMAPVIPECPECGQYGEVITDSKEGHYVCSTCGLILGNRIISDATEWRTFESDSHSTKSDPDRVGGVENPLLADLGLSTVIGDDKGMGLSRAHNRASNDKEGQQLLRGFREINLLAGKLAIQKNVVDRAQELYKRVLECKDFKTKKLDAVYASCLFIACRQSKVPRTIKELCAVADVKSRDLSRCFTKIKELKLYKATAGDAQAPQAEALLARFCSLLKLSQSVENAATHIAKRISDIGLADGKTPSTIAGAAILLASNLTEKPRSLAEVSSITHMAPATLRHCYLAVHPRRSELVPANFATPSAVKNLVATELK